MPSSQINSVAPLVAPNQALDASAYASGTPISPSRGKGSGNVIRPTPAPSSRVSKLQSKGAGTKKVRVKNPSSKPKSSGPNDLTSAGLGSGIGSAMSNTLSGY